MRNTKYLDITLIPQYPSISGDNAQGGGGDMISTVSAILRIKSQNHPRPWNSWVYISGLSPRGESAKVNSRMGSIWVYYVLIKLLFQERFLKHAFQKRKSDLGNALLRGWMGGWVDGL